MALITGGVAVGTGVQTGVEGFDQTLMGKASRHAANKYVYDIVVANIFSWE